MQNTFKNTIISFLLVKIQPIWTNRRVVFWIISLRVALTWRDCLHMKSTGINRSVNCLSYELYNRQIAVWLPAGVTHIFAYPVWSHGSADHAASYPGALSERQADNSQPSTTKTKKACSYTFITYCYQTWCLVYNRVWNWHTYWSWTLST